MKIYNRSTVRCDRQIWHSIASSLNVGGLFRDADLFDRKHLVAVIHEQGPTTARRGSNSGEYSCGRIDIYPCALCTPGFVFWTYLHELLHHWIDDKHRAVYFEPWCEGLCDTFATAVFTACGGQMAGENLCGNYLLDDPEITPGVMDILRKIGGRSTDDLRALNEPGGLLTQFCS